MKLFKLCIIMMILLLSSSAFAELELKLEAHGYHFNNADFLNYDAAAYAANPNLAFVLECTAADDIPHPDNEKNEGIPRLGDGPAITVMDRSFIADRRLVDLLVDDWQTAGEKSVSWDAGDLASGTYFVRINVKDDNITRKMLLIK